MTTKLENKNENVILAESFEYSDTWIKKLKIFWKRFKKNRFAVVGSIILLILYMASFLAPVIAPYPEEGLTDDIFFTDEVPKYSSYNPIEVITEKIIRLGYKEDLNDLDKLEDYDYLSGLGYLEEDSIFQIVTLASTLRMYKDMEAEGQNIILKPNFFGRDELGRDVFSRILYAGRVSLTIGFVSVGISVVIGTLWGCIAGYYGGWIDNIMMRIVDAIMCIPTFILLVTVMSIFEPSIFNVMIVLGLTSWTGLARMVRGEFLSLMKRDYAEAARGVGAKDVRIIFRHILPNAIAPIIVNATMGIAGAILSESALSFFGIGVQPPYASWGNMLTNAQELNTMLNAPWKAFYPGAFIFITVLSFNFLGDGLRDALDPRLKQ
ncbi:ABC transporter permease [Lutispora sp.]|nr:ABC transporter permease [Lutispora sp.]MEA4962563.1 ABC transporter permease [Lutispora sp.]HCJ56868.1 peptide ABC transporter permease [Clostridiaceae bacterium]